MDCVLHIYQRFWRFVGFEDFSSFEEFSILRKRKMQLNAILGEIREAIATIRSSNGTLGTVTFRQEGSGQPVTITGTLNNLGKKKKNCLKILKNFLFLQPRRILCMASTFTNLATFL